MKTILYDVKLRRPACILLQVAVGASVTTDDLSRFTAEWLTSPTPDMAKYEVTPEQLSRLQQMAPADGTRRARR